MSASSSTGPPRPQDFAFLPSVRLAEESDRKLVEKFVIEARECAKHDSQLLCEAAFEPLAVLVLAAADGSLPHSSWLAAVHQVLETAAPEHQGQFAAVRSVGALMHDLAQRVTPAAHARRLSLAFDEFINGTQHVSDAAALAPGLLRLLRGTMLLRTSESLSDAATLQARILRKLSELAQWPLGLAGLVQTPLLTALGVSWGSSDPSAAKTSAHTSASAPTGQAMGVEAADGGAPSSQRSSLELFLTAAELARRGNQRGAKHGCVLVVEEEEAPEASDKTGPGSRPQPTTILGEGWNHDVYERRGSQRRRVLHAECHAIADAIRRVGEARAFEAFERATCWIVELSDESGYDDAAPCPKCSLLLQACGVPRAIHSTRGGTLRTVRLPPQRSGLLAVENACKPLQYACDEMGLRCECLEQALRDAADAAQQRCDRGVSGTQERAAKQQRIDDATRGEGSGGAIAKE